MVYLVGAGPGDPGLLTLRGLECLKLADFVLYDGLVNPLLLRHTSATCERSNRARTATGGRLDQAEINRQLIIEAKKGKTVVRLKGGDPYIFGRGSEEAAALEAEGIPYEVVPGITAATAAGVYAGLSLTHRDHASAVAFITGHEDPTKTESSLNYRSLAEFSGTLVFYMGLHRLPLIADSLIEAGKPAETPAIVISRASRPVQTSVSGTLAELPRLVREAELVAPSLIIVGECVTQRERINWFERKPLLGTSIGITRPDHQADPEIEKATRRGMEPVLLPTITITPPADWSAVDAALDRLTGFSWLVFTSANGVRGLLDRLPETGRDLRSLGHLNFACIGPATAETLAEYHLRADLVPETYRSEALAETLAPHVRGKNVLWAGANRGREVLPNVLTDQGANVEKIVVYHNDDAETFPEIARQRLTDGTLDYIGLSSPSIAENFARLVPESARPHLGHRVQLVSISPVTTAAAKKVGLPITLEAEDYTWDGIFAAIEQHVTG